MVSKRIVFGARIITAAAVSGAPAGGTMSTARRPDHQITLPLARRRERPTREATKQVPALRNATKSAVRISRAGRMDGDWGAVGGARVVESIVKE